MGWSTYWVGSRWEKGRGSQVPWSPWTVHTTEKRVHGGGRCSHSRRAAMGSGGSAWPHRADLGQREASHWVQSSGWNDCRGRWVAACSSIAVGLSWEQDDPSGRGPGCGHPPRAFRASSCPRLLDPWGPSFLYLGQEQSLGRDWWEAVGSCGDASLPCAHGNLTICWLPSQVWTRRQPMWVLSLSKRRLWSLGNGHPWLVEAASLARLLSRGQGTSDSRRIKSDDMCAQRLSWEQDSVSQLSWPAVLLGKTSPRFLLCTVKLVWMVLPPLTFCNRMEILA